MAKSDIDLLVDVRGFSVSLGRNGTDTTVSWTVPKSIRATDGFLIAITQGSNIINPVRPLSGARYESNPLLQPNPQSKIGDGTCIVRKSIQEGDALENGSILLSFQPDVKLEVSLFAFSADFVYSSVCVSSSLNSLSTLDRSDPTTYAGSIPLSINAPSNPYDGQVFYNPNDGIVRVWSDELETWVRSSTGTIETGSEFPILVGKIHACTNDGSLKYFDGDAWQDCNASNTRIKIKTNYFPFNGFNTTKPTSITSGQIFIDSSIKYALMPEKQLRVSKLGVSSMISDGAVEVLVGSSFFPVPVSFFGFSVDLPNEYEIGSFFYHTKELKLFAWTGKEWVWADTDQAGSALDDKVGFGTNGNDQAIATLIEVLKLQLGAPKVCVELTEAHYRLAITNSLDTFRQTASNAYTDTMIPYRLKKGQTIYNLNNPIDDTHKISNIKNVIRNKYGTGGGGSSSVIGSDSYNVAMALANSMYGPTNGSNGAGPSLDMVGYHIMSANIEMVSGMLSSEIPYNWDQAKRLLRIGKVPVSDEIILLHVDLVRTEQELMNDTYCKQWLQEWAYSECLEYLGNIRGKYTSLPGPNGISLNGSELIATHKEIQTELKRQLECYEVGNLPPQAIYLM